MSLPVDKLLALLKASDGIMQTVLQDDRPGTLRTVARHVHDLLEVECCSVFLVPEDSANELVLEAQYADEKEYDFPPLRLPIRSVPRGGLTGHVAHEGKVVSLHGKDLWENPYVTGAPPSHLASGKCFSVCGVPLKDRKKRLLGLITINNKKGLDGKPGGAKFTSVDTSIAQIIANKIVIVLEKVRTSETLYKVMQTMNTLGTFQEILDDILKKGLLLLHADRGDFALWDEETRELIIRGSVGQAKFEIGSTIPEHSMMNAVWRSQGHMLCEDVSFETDYLEMDLRTRSEVALCVTLEGRPIGVLNAESFQRKAFDVQDLEVLRLLAQYAAIAVRMVGKEKQFQGMVQRLGEYSPPQHFLMNILGYLRDVYELDSGLIYIADDTNGILRCSAVICGKELGVEDDASKFDYSFGDRALATHVLRKKVGYFCPDPAHDPIVDQEEVKVFQIDSPIMGVPLIFGERAVGSLIVWRSQQPHLTPEHLEHLRPFAQLAAAAIAISGSEQRRSAVLARIQAILSRMQTELSLDKNLRLILKAIQAVGFDRVRVFKFQADTQRFVGLDSVGMEDSEAFCGYKICLDDNPYAKHTADTALPVPEARIYDSSRFGPDPHARGLRKPQGLPWAVVPLVIAGELYGQIVVDNERTGRELAGDNLGYLTLLGALAAQAIANADTIDALRACTLKDEFLQRMAHIFGTTTFGVKMLVQNLEDGIVDNSRALKEYIPAIAKMNERFVKLAQNIVDFAALRGDTKLNLEQADLVATVKDAVHNFEGHAQERGVRFATSFRSKELLWTLDPLRAGNAIEALLDNAIKFSPDEATVHIELWAAEHKAILTVRDEGRGVSDEDKRFVFDDFYRGQNARNSHVDGSGLGLSIVAQTMRLHDGDNVIENHPDGGAVFTLIFPERQE